MCYVLVCLVSSIGEIVEHLRLCSRIYGQNIPEISKKLNEKKNDFFWTIVPVFEDQQIMCCEILGGCSSFRTWKKSCNSTLKIVNFQCSSGLGYCI